MRCPVHSGAENPTSLALWIDRHGNPDRIAAYCHAQLCDYADIAKAVMDLFGTELNPSSEARYEVARWDYRNIKGETIYAVRWNTTGKDFKSNVTRDPKGVRGPFFSGFTTTGEKARWSCAKARRPSSPWRTRA